MISRVYKGLAIGYNISGTARENPSNMVFNGRKPLAEIRAFRGTFYDPSKIKDLSGVLAPPYDIINDRKRRELLSFSPYNIVRMILPQNDSDHDFWDSSASLFRAWKEEGILKEDTYPSLYIYRQTFNLPDSGPTGRTGIMAILRCRDFSSGEVLPHEKTFKHTRIERLNLLRACRANFSQVFTVFRDPREEVLPLLDVTASGPAFADFTDTEGIRHQLWRIEEPTGIDKLVRVIGKRRLIIADGHHRYETALLYGNENPDSTRIDNPDRYVAVALFRSEDPGLAILPVHRILRSLPMNVEEVFERIGRCFEVEMLREGPGGSPGMFKEKLESYERPGFIMLTASGAALLMLREGIDPAKSLEGQESERWKRLDVSILHSLVLGEKLGIDADSMAEKGDLYFTPWGNEAISEVAGGEAEAAFLMRPARMQEIWEIAEGGERMPHKSSYFYPKLPSGLVIYDHDTALA